MSEVNQTEQYDSRFVLMTTGELVRLLVWGAVVGLVTWGLTWLFDTYVYQALLCKGDALRCSSSLTYASATAIVLAAIGSLLGLVRLRVYRPLLIVLAVTISLWGVTAMVSPLAWYWAALMSLLVFGLAYGLYGWISRLRYLWLMLLITIILIVIVRLVLTA